ncbi:MAG TPA: tripartite tricarboxylate transporter substrate-binding protein [Paracoccus sp. (in: a-proteobacteria)]|uniref:Bug family tripartite tricarboxylate transporter substrate binding protein n=1 Tax=Paracoccus sp. TaxID=267 RepID=UPI002D1A9452|nr:tripartite tricarboxylate transporter substrate-binding protein [Paracoccus sp. (in: a-proteobacteria)]HWL59043.1 tripartite tricarboxylate transporter substrate-binding protein [Paracoccus sp. (in: a-proteobacteria)]
MKMIRRAAAIAATVLAAGFGTTWGTAALAQSGADFFNGKTVNYVVATSPGGGYDTNGRLVAEFMQKHLPGSTFVIRNMPGAGHMIGAAFIYAAKPDGLTLGTFNTGLIYSQLTGEAGSRFDLGKMDWVGKLTSDPRVIIVAKDSGITSYEDLLALKEPVRFAAAGVGSASTVETQMLITSLDLPVNLITGYDGNDGLLAIRRGEVVGTLGARSSLEPFVKEGHAVMIAQIGGSQTDVPQLASLVKDNEAGQRVISLVASQGNISRLTAAPKGIPEDRLEALRTAYEAAVTDPEFLERANKMELPIDPVVGAPVGDAVAEALNQTPEMVEFLKTTLKGD